jgi:hypothetical protein
MAAGLIGSIAVQLLFEKPVTRAPQAKLIGTRARSAPEWDRAREIDALIAGAGCAAVSRRDVTIGIAAKPRKRP